MNTKRRISVLLAVLALVFMMTDCSVCGQHQASAEALAYTFPGEWQEHEGTWLIWPHDQGLITPEVVDQIDEIWITMTQALHTGEKVHIVAYSEAEQTRISDLLKQSGVDMAQVDFLIAETDQSWARDCGPLFVLGADGMPAVLDFGYNGYGRMDKLGPDVPEDLRWEMPEFIRGEYLENYVKDDVLAAAVAGKLGYAAVDLNSIVLEGGALELDGCGTLITTESCVLNENRNPGMTREEAERIFENYLGVTNVIWLEGTADEDITDGHIDGLVRFADSKTIITMSEDDYYETYDYTPEEDYGKVVNAKNAEGDAYNIVELPITAEDVECLGWRANYLNYYAGNDAVIVPVYGDIMDEQALSILGEVYPGKEIVPIDGQVLALVGGGVHCVTQQQPLFEEK